MSTYMKHGVFIVTIQTNPLNIIWYLEQPGIQLTRIERRPYTLVDCVVIGSDNRLSPVQHQAIIWTNVDFFMAEA